MISRFRYQYEFLSNFYKSLIIYKGRKYQTAEHLLQSFKTKGLREKAKIRRAVGPSEAKALGRAVLLRSDWEKVKDRLMAKVVKLKFEQNRGILFELFDTAPQELVEGNYWHDNYWGNCLCNRCSKIQGYNALGKILVEYRDNNL